MHKVTYLVSDGYVGSHSLVGVVSSNSGIAEFSVTRVCHSSEGGAERS